MLVKNEQFYITKKLKLLTKYSHNHIGYTDAQGMEFSRYNPGSK